MPKKPYQLGLVTGIKKSLEEYKMKDTCTNILLRVTGLWDDVKISMLSDEDFMQEECNDLVSSVKNGILEKPTIVRSHFETFVLLNSVPYHVIYWMGRVTMLFKKQCFF